MGDTQRLQWSKTLQFSINCYMLSWWRFKHLTFIKTRTTYIQSKLDAGCLTYGALTLGGPHHLCERLLYVFMSLFDVFDIDGKRATFIEHRYIWAFFCTMFSAFPDISPVRTTVLQSWANRDKRPQYTRGGNNIKSIISFHFTILLTIRFGSGNDKNK